MTDAERPRVGIVVPTKDPEREPARRCLELLRATTAGHEVDLQVVVSSGPSFRLSRSLNQGLEATKDADAWVLLNDDCFMDPGWLDAMLDTLRLHPEVGVVGAVLRYPDRRVQHAGGRIVTGALPMLAAALRKGAPIWGVRRLAAQGRLKAAWDFTHHDRLGPETRLDYVTGACMMLTRPCRERVGVFDERYAYGYEDADLCLRAREAGFELAIAEAATGVHLEGASRGRLGAMLEESRREISAAWPGERVERAVRGRLGVVHPSRCGHAGVSGR